MSSVSLSNNDRFSTKGRMWQQGIWWLLFCICAFFSAFAFTMVAVDILFRLGIAPDARYRALPAVFIIHALLGGVALLCAPLQFNRTLFQKYRKLHRLLGRTYVVTIGTTSISAFWLAIYFDVTIPAKILFGLLAILWFSTTAIAFLRIRARKVAEHREWMIRSFALTFFFVTFTFWVDGLASTALPESVSYPLAIFLSWSLNLVVAELWIRYTRREIDHDV